VVGPRGVDASDIGSAWDLVSATVPFLALAHFLDAPLPVENRLFYLFLLVYLSHDSVLLRELLCHWEFEGLNPSVSLEEFSIYSWGLGEGMCY